MATYKLIASSTVGSGGASSITFSSIPQTYTDLVIKTSIRSNRSNAYDGIVMEFNGDTTTANYQFRYLYANSSTPGSGTTTTGFAGYGTSDTATANTFGNGEVYIPNYTSSNYKSWGDDSVGENNSGSAGNFILCFHTGLWSNTAAITQIRLKPEIGGSVVFNQYSTVYLYGISNA